MGLSVNKKAAQLWELKRPLSYGMIILVVVLFSLAPCYFKVDGKQGRKAYNQYHAQGVKHGYFLSFACLCALFAATIPAIPTAAMIMQANVKALIKTPSK